MATKWARWVRHLGNFAHASFVSTSNRKERKKPLATVDGLRGRQLAAAGRTVSPRVSLSRVMQSLCSDSSATPPHCTDWISSRLDDNLTPNAPQRRVLEIVQQLG